ncbi:MAG: aspartate-semialdehyde dehydrogenase [Chloroflexi bacterium OLB15]|nr:MAG: aspartate-semialdehyde dehydrogenase [Chloroflexi bacterium OLB15]
MEKLHVAILGATGAVGQRFIQLLENHPWFEVTELVASDRSAGRTYAEAARWVLDGEPPANVRDIRIKPLDSDLEAPLVFSALPKEAADPHEIRLANAGHIVCTNASLNRMLEDVPLLLPEVNAEHIALVDVQRARRGWTTGALVANSNCTIMPVVMSLAPLRQFGIEKILIVSSQAISGAGYPGVSALDILDNIIPYIGGEEDKMETESLRMLGSLEGDLVEWLPAVVSATSNRAPVIDGHLVNISVSLKSQPHLDNILEAWAKYRGIEPIPSLPSAPVEPVHYFEQPDRPQPRRDRNYGKGMTTTVGRLRSCPLLGYKFVALSHNTIRGAAGCSILNAELLAAKGYISGFQPVVTATKADLLPA